MSSLRFRSLALGLGLIGVGAGIAGCAAPQPEVAHAYVNGLYAAQGNYTSPSGMQGIHVALRIEDDKVKSVTVTPTTYSGTAAEFQKRFASAIRGEIVGKDIDSIEVSRLAGSSLTSVGFSQALDKIKTEAVEP